MVDASVGHVLEERYEGEKDIHRRDVIADVAREDEVVLLRTIGRVESKHVSNRELYVDWTALSQMLNKENLNIKTK